MSVFRRKKDPKQERSQETVEAILQAVVDLLDQKDPSVLTTTRIAERAGVSIGSLYQYFPGKEAIFSTMIEWYLRKELALIVGALASAQDRAIEQTVDEMLSQIIATRIRNLKLEQALMGFFTRMGDFEFLKRYDEQLVAELDKALITAAENGHVKRTEVTAFLLLHVIRSAFFATTMQKPELYERQDDLKAGLRKAVLAILG